MPVSGGGCLNDLIIGAEAVPGRDSVEGFVSHFRFVRDHHSKIARVAFVSDPDVLAMLHGLARHYVSAEVKYFEASQLNDAIAWMA
jgi:hypothetical protein